MLFVVLTSKPDSPYADTSKSYEYPRRYQRLLQPLAQGEPMIAILYGPSDSTGRRMAYIGWAALTGAPVPSPRLTSSGEPQWVVSYVDDIQYFPNPVPFRLMGEAMEQWVRDWPVGSPDMRGRSVRFMEDEDARRILELGYAGSPSLADYQTPSVDVPTLLVAERSKRLVEAVTRDARFRKDVMAAYDFTCAVTGLTAGGVSRREAVRLMDAAHIRPVGDHGPDIVGNGLSLTPTVHRLFDEGLVSLKWKADQLRLVVSPRLDASMVQAPERGTVISLVEGSPLLLPSDRASWPNADVVRYHNRRVFKGPESLVS